MWLKLLPLGRPLTAPTPSSLSSQATWLKRVRARASAGSLDRLLEHELKMTHTDIEALLTGRETEEVRWPRIT